MVPVWQPGDSHGGIAALRRYGRWKRTAQLHQWAVQRGALEIEPAVYSPVRRRGHATLQMERSSGRGCALTRQMRMVQSPAIMAPIDGGDERKALNLGRVDLNLL